MTLVKEKIRGAPNRREKIKSLTLAPRSKAGHETKER